MAVAQGVNGRRPIGGSVIRSSVLVVKCPLARYLTPGGKPMILKCMTETVFPLGGSIKVDFNLNLNLKLSNFTQTKMCQLNDM